MEKQLIMVYYAEELPSGVSADVSPNRLLKRQAEKLDKNNVMLKGTFEELGDGWESNLRPF